MEWLKQINPQINEMWRGDWHCGFVEPARYLYDHELVCVLEGSFTLIAENESYHLEAGTFIIVPPNMRHLSEALSAKVRRACVHFDWQGVQRQVRDGIVCYHPKRPQRNQICNAPIGVPTPVCVGRFDLEGEVPRTLDLLFARWSLVNEQDKAMCRGLFMELLTLLYWPKSVSKFPDRGRGVQLAYATKTLLDQRKPDDKESIQDLLATLGFSYAHLARLFRKTFGQAPLTYFNSRALEKARMHLDDPSTSVQEAADAAGFHDVSYFIRSFRRHFGQTPREYRDTRMH